MVSDLAGRRRDYALGGLNEDTAGPNPVALFWRWYASAADLYEPNAMVLSTVTAAGTPDSRTVLLKGLDERGFVFFTSYRSAKSRQIAERPCCSLLFPWFELQRQVRVTGIATTLAREESEAYFATRPRGSQLGAWASLEAGGQSSAVTARTVLDEALEAAEERFANSEVPCPESWGGYLVRPATFEFWQGRTGRLHDRLHFERADEGWLMNRLAP